MRNTTQYRAATLQDLHDFTRLADSLNNISWFTRCCVATDVPDLFELDINTAYALIKGTKKPVGTSFTVASSVDPIIDMFDIALGGKDKFREKPFCKAHISPVISPLRYGEDAFDVAMACIRRGVPLNNIIAAQWHAGLYLGRNTGSVGYGECVRTGLPNDFLKLALRYRFTNRLFLWQWW